MVLPTTGALSIFETVNNKLGTVCCGTLRMCLWVDDASHLISSHCFFLLRYWTKQVATIGALSLGIAATSSTSPEAAFAADVDQGQKIFNANCAACHRGGQNMIAPEKTLEKAALEQFLSSNKERSTEESVKWQISHGRSSMPSFGGRLDDESIANVAAYVVKSSEEGWNNWMEAV